MKSKNAENYENVIVRDNKEIGINNYGLDYLISLEQKIDKANEILNKGCFEYDNCPDNVINEIIELKEILGGKE